MRVIAYVSHGSLLQHLPTISSYLFTCLLSEASLWSMKSSMQIDRIIIIIRLLPTERANSRVPLRRSLTKCMQHVIDSAIPNTSLTSVGVTGGTRGRYFKTCNPDQNDPDNQIPLSSAT